MRWFSIDIVPVKRRARFDFRNNHAYTDKKTIAEMKAVKKAYRGPLYGGPVALLVRVFKPKVMAKGKSAPYIQKPDIDNVVKCVMDALTGRAYLDDSQVVAVYARKLDRQPIGTAYCEFAVIEADMLAASVDAEFID